MYVSLLSSKTAKTLHLFPMQGSTKEWSLGCELPASWSPLAAGARFTQPRDHSPCMCAALVQIPSHFHRA